MPLGNWRRSDSVKLGVVLPRLATVALVLAVRLQAQTAAPVFDVVSLRPVSAEPGGPPRLMGMRRSPGRIDVGSWSIKQLILRAYGLWPSQLLGPEWMDAARYDVSYGCRPFRT
jgi:hypothetical protein